MVNKESFIAQYVCQFLAAYQAVEYVRNCQLGWPSKDQPIEDAKLLAENAWNQFQEIECR